MPVGIAPTGFTRMMQTEGEIAGADAILLSNHGGRQLDRAETRRFELLKAIKPYLVSSEAHSTGLCDVSLYGSEFSV